MKKYYRYDLHIHSDASINKDSKEILKNSSIDNLDTLLSAMKKNEIDIFSITDHNTIYLDLYKKIINKNLSLWDISNFFVGLELDVVFSKNNENKTHVLIYFNIDKNSGIEYLESKVIYINKLLDELIPKEDINGVAISSKERKMDINNFASFINKLQLEKIDIVTIATQKQDPNNYCKKNNSLNADAGNAADFKVIVSNGYFSGIEVTNSKVKAMVQNFFKENSIEQFGAISGSDCHDWNVYPKHHDYDENTNIKKSFLAKTTPTFNGFKLIFEFPNTRLVHNKNSFQNMIELASFEFQDKNFDIPFTEGINILFGDNGIGKTTIIKQINKNLNLRKDKNFEDPSEKEGRDIKILKTDLKNNNTVFPFSFLQQNKSKAKIDIIIPTIKEKLPNLSDSYIKNYFQELMDSIVEIVKSNIQISEIRRSLESLIIENKINNLSLTKPFYPVAEKISKPSKIKFSTEKKLIGDLNKIIDKSFVIKKVEDSDYISKKINDEITKSFKDLKVDYQIFISLIKERYESESAKINLLNKVDVISGEYSKSVGANLSDVEKERTTFTNELESGVQKIFQLIQAEHDLSEKRMKFDKLRDSYVIQEYADYVRVDSRLIFKRDYQYKSQSFEILYNLFQDELFSNKKIEEWEKTTSAETFSLITRGASASSKIEEIEAQLKVNFEKFIKAIMKEVIEISNTGEIEGLRNISNVSPGEVAAILLEIFFSERESENISLYIIDQPEDELSGNKITKTLLPTIIENGKESQIIAITHNPNILINLDPDNLIYISEVNGELVVQNGTIDDEKMLDIISDKVEGGKEAIRKRIKVYEKN